MTLSGPSERGRRYQGRLSDENERLSGLDLSLWWSLRCVSGVCALRLCDGTDLVGKEAGDGVCQQGHWADVSPVALQNTGVPRVRPFFVLVF